MMRLMLIRSVTPVASSSSRFSGQSHEGEWGGVGGAQTLSWSTTCGRKPISDGLDETSRRAVL